jgi:hypothetical protein
MVHVTEMAFAILAEQMENAWRGSERTSQPIEIEVSIDGSRLIVNRY